MQHQLNIVEGRTQFTSGRNVTKKNSSISADTLNLPEDNNDGTFKLKNEDDVMEAVNKLLD